MDSIVSTGKARLLCIERSGNIKVNAEDIQFTHMFLHDIVLYWDE